RRRVVDAGYYDNYGVSLAASYLFGTKHDTWIRAHASKVLLIQVRDGLDDNQRRLREIPPDPSTQLSRATEEATSPLEGLYNARVGSSSFRNDGQAELLSAFYRKGTAEGKARSDPPISQEERYFSTVILEFPGHASLSWYLSKAE